MKSIVLLTLLALPTTMTLAQLALGSDCQLNSECDSNSCAFGRQPLDSPGTCVCNIETNAGCVDGVEECGVPEGLMDVFPMCLTATVECTQNSDCIETDRCFFGEQPMDAPGTCRCNSKTNAGCEEPLVCTDADVSFDGLPRCELAVETCFEDSDCTETNRCFFGFQPVDTPGTCQCNSETNAGCTEPFFCTDVDLAFDGPPRCALSIGESCDRDNECETSLCYKNFLVPGMCICNLNTNFGCAEGELCLPIEGMSDVPPRCVNATAPTSSPTTNGGVTKASMGEACLSGDDCVTARCFFGEQPDGAPGTCQCNAKTNEGCEPEKECSDVETASDGLPTCTACGDPYDGCIGMDNWMGCRDLELGGCSNISIEKSCPVKYKCVDATPSPTLAVGATDKAGTSPPSAVPGTSAPAPVDPSPTPGSVPSGASKVQFRLVAFLFALLLLVSTKA